MLRFSVFFFSFSEMLSITDKGTGDAFKPVSKSLPVHFKLGFIHEKSYRIQSIVFPMLSMLPNQKLFGLYMT